MGYGLIDNNTLSDIANAIRYKANSVRNYYPRDMALAINHIASAGEGGSFKYPVMLSLRSQRDTGNIVNSMYNYLYIERTNEISNLINSDLTLHVIYKDHWPMSPADITVYTRNGFYEKVLVNQGHFIGMCPNFGYGHSGNTEKNILAVFPNGQYQMGYQAQYGDVLTNSTYNVAYIWDNKYYPNGINCWRSVIDLGYDGGGKLYNNIFQNNSKVIYNVQGMVLGLGIDSDTFSPDDISIIEMDYLANSCRSVCNAYSGPYTKTMVNTYPSTDITVAECGQNVTDLINTYVDCDGLKSAVIGPSVINMYNAYVYCSNIENIIGNANNVTYAQNAFYSCSNLRRTLPFPSLENAFGMFSYCPNIIDLPYTPNLVNGAAMFYGCYNLSINDAQNFLNNCEKLVNASSMFSFGYNENSMNIMNLDFPNTVTDLCYMYEGDKLYYTYDENNQQIPHSWVDGDAVCSDTVINIVNSYRYCYNLLNAKVGNNVVNMDNCYEGCNKLLNGICGPNVKYFNNAYKYCNNLVSCECGDNVLYMIETYRSCYNLTTPVCGNNVIYMTSAYLGCVNLNQAVCGPNVIGMSSAYYGCTNITEPVCGENVKLLASTYSDCTNLLNAVCGNNVLDMSDAYANCEKITTGVCGPNVSLMNRAFKNCASLTDAIIGNNVSQADNTYAECFNLKNAYICNGHYSTTAGYGTLSYAFRNCWKLDNVTIEDDVYSMYHTFENCNSLISIKVPENAVQIPYAFNNCVNIESDIEIGYACNNIANAFRGCNKIANVFIEGNGFASATGYYPILHAFYRNNYLIRRNVVINNYAGWNKLIYYNFAGNWTRTNETYAEPLEVFVNGKSYNTVRCSYNVSYNCYIYCTE